MFRGAVLTPLIRMFSVSLWSPKAVTDDLLELDRLLQKFDGIWGGLVGVQSYHW